MVKVLIYIKMLLIFSTSVLIRHLWQLKAVVFLHWCLIRAVLLGGKFPYDLYFPARVKEWDNIWMNARSRSSPFSRLRCFDGALTFCPLAFPLMTFDPMT